MSLSEFLQIAALVASLLGGAWVLLSLAGRQYDKRLADRFAAQDKAREEDRARWDERQRQVETKLERLDGDLRKLLIELPREYVARADYVRRETVVEAKIDRLGLQMENHFLRAKGSS